MNDQPESVFTKKYKVPKRYRAIVAAVVGLVTLAITEGVGITDIVGKLSEL